MILILTIMILERWWGILTTDDVEQLRYLGAEVAFELLDVSECDIIEVENPPFEIRGKAYNKRFLDFDV